MSYIIKIFLLNLLNYYYYFIYVIINNYEQYKQMQSLLHLHTQLTWFATPLKCLLLLLSVKMTHDNVEPLETQMFFLCVFLLIAAG